MRQLSSDDHSWQSECSSCNASELPKVERAARTFIIYDSAFCAHFASLMSLIVKIDLLLSSFKDLELLCKLKNYENDSSGCRNEEDCSFLHSFRV